MTTKRKKASDEEQQRAGYEKPRVQRVDLALAETLSSGCKLAGVCDDPFFATFEAGS